jgi:hypothetical protein
MPKDAAEYYSNDRLLRDLGGDSEPMKKLAFITTALLTFSMSVLGAPEYGSVVVSEVRSI